MNARRAAVLAALPLLFLLERAAYYGMRSVLMMHLNGTGMAMAEARSVMSTGAFLVAVTPLLGGILGIFTGPRALIPAGAVVAAVGYLVLGAGGPGSVGVAMVLIALGGGLFKPGVLGVAGQEMGRDLDTPRAALCLLLYGAINFGAFVSGVGASAAARDSYTTVFFTSAALSFVALVVAAGLVAVLQWAGARPEPAARTLRAELGGGILIAGVTPLLVAFSVLSAIEFEAMETGGGFSGPTSAAWLFSVNPVVVMAMCGIGATALFVLWYSKIRVPLLYAIAGGFGVFALGAAVMLLAGQPPSLPLVALGSAFTAAGEAIVMPLAMSRVLGVSNHRWTTLAGSLWLMSSGLFGAVAGFAFTEAPRVGLGLSLLGCLAVGASLAALARLMNRELFDFTPSPFARPGAGS
ncbi:MAG: hypothetical protein R3F14_32815 [Polyangiaceae bacterium]